MLLFVGAVIRVGGSGEEGLSYSEIVQAQEATKEAAAAGTSDSPSISTSYHFWLYFKSVEGAGAPALYYTCRAVVR